MTSADEAPEDPDASDDAPSDDPEAHAADPVCPFCGSRDAEPVSRFGSEVSAEQWYCRGCRTVFERLRYDGRRPGTGRSDA